MLNKKIKKVAITLIAVLSVLLHINCGNAVQISEPGNCPTFEAGGLLLTVQDAETGEEVADAQILLGDFDACADSDTPEICDPFVVSCQILGLGECNDTPGVAAMCAAPEPIYYCNSSSGTYTLSIEREGYQSLVREVDIIEDECGMDALELTVEIEPTT